MKYELAILFCAFCFSGIRATNSETGNLLESVRDTFLKDGYPRLSYYDGAKLIEDGRTFYEDFKSKLQLAKLERSTFTAFSKELLTKNGIELFTALTKFYTKTLSSFDRILALLVKIRKEQKKSDIVAGQALVDMFNAISELNVEENDTFLAGLLEFLNTIGRVNRDIVKNLYKLAKKHKDLQNLMEVHEDGTVELKEICKKYTKLAELSPEFGESLSEVAEPVATLIMLGTLFGAI